MRFSYSIVHVPGKDLCIADALSRAPVRNLEAMEDLQKVTDAFVNLTIETNQAILSKPLAKQSYSERRH